MNSHIKFDSKNKKNSSLCIFASYHKGLYVEDFIYYYLNHLFENNFDIVFVSNSPILEFDLLKLNKICKRVLEKENMGLDFSAYKMGLLTENYGRNYDSLLLTNVSIYGPLFPIKNIIKQMEVFDFWGLSENYEVAYHLQSYFLFFNSKVTNSSIWQTFWDNVQDLEDKEDIVFSYEIGLSRQLIESSLFNYSSYVRYFDFIKYLKEQNGYYFAEGSPELNKYNSTLFYWDILIEKFNFPFLKKTLVDKKDEWKRGGIITRHWKDIVTKNSQYPVELINEN